VSGLRHVVLLKWVESVTEEQRHAVVDALRALPAVIPELRSYDVRADAGIDDDTYDLAVVAEFDDAEGYIVYRDHPEHQRVIAELIGPILAARAPIQTELD
jgi:hypothetical protein